MARAVIFAHSPRIMRLSHACLIAAAIILAEAVALHAMGHPLICKCGYVKLWEGKVMSSENSQHIADWYSPSHVIHGFIFYGLLWLVARKLPIGTRFLLAVVIEAAWETIENTPLVIDRYRAETISLDYYGDSILNSVSDILFMILGFFLARVFPVWLTAVVAIGMELFTGYMIRDNLTLNIIMLLWPLDAIKEWQAGR